ALRRHGGPAKGGGLERISLIERGVRAQLEAAECDSVGRPWASILYERQQLGHAVKNKQHTLEPEERGDVDRVGADDGEIHGRRIGVTAGALELEPGTQRLPPGQRRHRDQKEERELKAWFHSTVGSIPA